MAEESLDVGGPIINRALKANSFCGDLFDLSDSDKELISQLTVPVPVNENERVKVLRQAKVLDSDLADPTFDRFTSLASRLFDTPIALVSLVDVNRQWFKSRVGKYLQYVFVICVFSSHLTSRSGAF
jgi:hypothetical protein